MAQAKLQSEEHGLAEAEARLATLLIEEVNGSSATTHCPSGFYARVGRVACIGAAIAVGKRRFAFSIAHGDTMRRTGEETSSEFVHTIPRFGADASGISRQHGGHGAESSCDERNFRIFLQDGNTHRQCRGKSAIASFQPTVELITDRSRHVRAKYGLRAVRVGEATHPGPEDDECSELVDALQRDLGGEKEMATQPDTLSGSNRFFRLTDDAGQSDADGSHVVRH